MYKECDFNHVIIMKKLSIINSIKKNLTNKKNYLKNEIIFNENDSCDSLGIILEGNVIISSFTYDGKEIVFNKLSKNDMFGQSLLFSSSPKYKGSIISLNNSSIGYINKKDLIELLKNEENLLSYLSLLSDSVLLSKEKSRTLSFENVKDRLLYHLSIYNKIEYKTITSLAKELCVTREALSRTLKKLSTSKIINIEGKCITLIK